MPKGIIVFGLNGSGKSTIGSALAKALNYKFMDLEDYHFAPSDPPYTQVRPRQERQALMMSDVKNYGKFVMASVKGDLGDEISDAYIMGVLLKVPHEIRMHRVHKRAIDKHGERVMKGGDMHQANLDFMKFVKGRNHQGIDDWMANQTFPILTVDGTRAIDEIVQDIMTYYSRI